MPVQTYVARLWYQQLDAVLLKGILYENELEKLEKKIKDADEDTDLTSVLEVKKILQKDLTELRMQLEFIEAQIRMLGRDPEEGYLTDSDDSSSEEDIKVD